MRLLVLQFVGVFRHLCLECFLFLLSHLFISLPIYSFSNLALDSLGANLQCNERKKNKTTSKKGNRKKNKPLESRLF